MIALLAAALLLAAASPGFAELYPVELTSTAPSCSATGGLDVDFTYDNDSDSGDNYAYVDLYMGTAGLFAEVQSIAEIDAAYEIYDPNNEPIPGTYGYHAGTGIGSAGEASYPHHARSGGTASATDSIAVEQNPDPDPNTFIVLNGLIDFGASWSTSGNGTGVSGGAALTTTNGLFNITMSFGPSGGYHYGSYTSLSGTVSVGTPSSPTQSPNGSYWAQMNVGQGGQVFDYGVSISLSNAQAWPTSGTSTYTTGQFASVALYAFTAD
jgi:hypothetical protein